MRELKDLLDQIKAEPRVEFLVPYIVYTGYRFETWRDRLLEQQVDFEKGAEA